MKTAHPRSNLLTLLVAFLLGGLLWRGDALADDTGELRIESLAKLCEVWSTVKFLHPRLMTGSVDWDGALVRAIPRVREAQGDQEVAEAIGSMLAELRDPATRVVSPSRDTPDDTPLYQWDEDVLIVNLGPHADAAGIISLYEALAPLTAEMGKADRVVLDLRTTENIEWVLPMLPLVDEPVPAISFRYPFHSGYAPQAGSTSGGYYSGFLTTAEPPLEPQQGNRETSPRLVFTVESEVPMAAAALWWEGKAAIVSEQQLTDESLGLTETIDLGGGWSARIRVGESTIGGISADAVAEDAITTALALARSDEPLTAHPRRDLVITPVVQKDEPYAEMAYPDLPYRLLALFRAWSILDQFYPYKHLIGDWDAVLRDFIPRFEDAGNARDYAEAIMELAARVEDGHTSVWGHPALDEIAPRTAVLPLEIRAVEGKYLITGMMQALPNETPVSVGDEVLRIDGEPLEDRIERLWKYFPASTEAARLHRVLQAGTRGAKDSIAELVVRGADGATRTVEVSRSSWSPRAIDKPVIDVLEGNIGYADLTRLTVGQVDEMFDTLENTEGIIFDMRGYPRGTAWAIAPRINTNDAKVGASFRRAQISAFSSEMARSGFYFDQQMPMDAEVIYRRPTVMLIDDRTISQAEHSGLFFEAANGTTFIGSHSAGANGDVTNLVLPGGVYIQFTGHDVRHADGRQLQRTGLIPDVPVEPTIDGIRGGRDEVLERAVDFLRTDDRR